MGIDLRVDDSPDPVVELDRLVDKWQHYQSVVRTFRQALDGDPVTVHKELEQLRAQDPFTEPDQVLWRAVVAARAERQDAELASCAPQHLEAARRFGPAGLLPQDVLDRILPEQR